MDGAVSTKECPREGVPDCVIQVWKNYKLFARKY